MLGGLVKIVADDPGSRPAREDIEDTLGGMDGPGERLVPRGGKIKTPFWTCV
jgi:hypothetical protein